MAQSIAIDHKRAPSTYRTRIPIHSGKGFFTEFWYDPQALDVAHWLCDSFAEFIAPVSFVLDCQVPGLVSLQVVARAVADHKVVLESQVVNLA